KGEVRGVYRGEQAVKALDALRRVARVANQSKLEGPVLRMHSGKAEHQGGSQHDKVWKTAPFIITKMRTDRVRHGFAPYQIHFIATSCLCPRKQELAAKFPLLSGHHREGPR